MQTSTMNAGSNKGWKEGEVTQIRVRNNNANHMGKFEIQIGDKEREKYTLLPNREEGFTVNYQKTNLWNTGDVALTVTW